VKVGILMPKHNHFLVQIGLQGILHVTIAVRSGENDYSEFHGLSGFAQRYEKAGRGRRALLKIVHK
jgi:hypothetical protein